MMICETTKVEFSSININIGVASHLDIFRHEITYKTCFVCMTLSRLYMHTQT